MSDMEDLDVLLGNVQGNAQVRDENVSDADFDLVSRRQEGDANLVGKNVRSLLITNVSEKSEITAETSRANNEEISSQKSRKFEGRKSDLNLHILVDTINSAIDEKVIPTIKIAIGGQNLATNYKFRPSV